MMNFDRITVNAGVCQGRATIRGTRITVEFARKLLDNGYTTAEIVQEYPELEEGDVDQCVAYGTWLADERTVSVG